MLVSAAKRTARSGRLRNGEVGRMLAQLPGRSRGSVCTKLVEVRAQEMSAMSDQEHGLSVRRAKAVAWSDGEIALLKAHLSREAPGETRELLDDRTIAEWFPKRTIRAARKTIEILKRQGFGSRGRHVSMVARVGKKWSATEQAVVETVLDEAGPDPPMLVRLAEAVAPHLPGRGSECYCLQTLQDVGRAQGGDGAPHFWKLWRRRRTASKRTRTGFRKAETIVARGRYKVARVGRAALHASAGRPPYCV
jgi:hypothetical protein